MASFPLLHLREQSSNPSLPFLHEAAITRASLLMTRIEAEYDLATFDLCAFQSWVARKRQRELHIIRWQMPMNILTSTNK